LPSNALARRVAQIGSTSTDAAEVKAVILSAVISIPSSARIRAAYVAARSVEAYGGQSVSEMLVHLDSPSPRLHPNSIHPIHPPERGISKMLDC
jgi:hypothetical protein